MYNLSNIMIILKKRYIFLVLQATKDPRLLRPTTMLYETHSACRVLHHIQTVVLTCGRLSELTGGSNKTSAQLSSKLWTDGVVYRSKSNFYPPFKHNSCREMWCIQKTIFLVSNVEVSSISSLYYYILTGRCIRLVLSF